MSNNVNTAILISVLLNTAVAQGAEFEVHPSLAVSEEFTDNVFESSTNRRSDYITRILPGFIANYSAPALTGNLSYLFDVRRYAKKTHEDEVTHALSAEGHLVAVENLLFLDVSDEYKRVSLDTTRELAKESLFVNQSDRNVATVTPYLQFHPIERIMVKSGYTFIDTRYFKSSAIDKNDHVAFVALAYELSKRFSLTVDYRFTRETADIDNLSQHNALGGFRYEYADKSFVFAQGGKAWTRYDSGLLLNSTIWNAGITHVFNTTTATLTTGVRYDEDPLSNVIKESFANGKLEKSFSKGSLSLSSQYSEYYLTRTNTMQIKKYGANVQGQYEFSADLKGTLGLAVEKYEQPLLGSYTRRIQVEPGLSYLLAKELIASLSYIYTDYYSPGIVADNKHVNRGMIEFKKIF